MIQTTEEKIAHPNNWRKKLSKQLKKRVHIQTTEERSDPNKWRKEWHPNNWRKKWSKQVKKRVHIQTTEERSDPNNWRKECTSKQLKKEVIQTTEEKSAHLNNWREKWSKQLKKRVHIQTTEERSDPRKKNNCRKELVRRLVRDGWLWASNCRWARDKITPLKFTATRHKYRAAPPPPSLSVF